MKELIQSKPGEHLPDVETAWGLLFAAYLASPAWAKKTQTLTGRPLNTVSWGDRFKALDREATKYVSAAEWERRKKAVAEKDWRRRQDIAKALAECGLEDILPEWWGDD